MTEKPLEIRTDRDVAVPMRDGTILRADVTRPVAEGRYPVLLQRTPYDKQSPIAGISIEVAASRGYAVILQDVRGLFASEGDFHVFSDEAEDGYDTIEWAADQPWADGNVGMFGYSYAGINQLLAAVESPPHLVCLFPCAAAIDNFRAPVYPGGALNLNLLHVWLLSMLPELGRRNHVKYPPDLQALLDELARRPEVLQKGDAGEIAAQNKRIGEMIEPMSSHLPLKTMTIPRDGAPFSLEWLENNVAGPYWERLSVAHRFSEVRVPALHLGGWYDMYPGATVEAYSGLHDRAATAESRTGQRLVMGPWVHGSRRPQCGELNFGPQAGLSSADFTELHLRWFDYWLKGKKNGLLDEPSVRLFVMGKNLWREENEWPLARTEYTRFYLHSVGQANTLDGDGILSFQTPSDERPDTFQYDPNDPVPTLGGGILGLGELFPGAFDQRPVEIRQDVLVYTSDVLQSDLEVTGPLTVELWAASSAPDTDFTAKLVDVHPNGYAQNIQEGIFRARFRESFRHPQLIEPDKPLPYHIDLRATSNVFLAGHRVRLEISSSNFPNYDRNPNTGHSFGDDAELAVAKQTIFHDAAHPSCIILPVIPNE